MRLEKAATRNENSRDLERLWRSRSGPYLTASTLLLLKRSDENVVLLSFWPLKYKPIGAEERRILRRTVAEMVICVEKRDVEVAGG
ncbi:hypothetical protein RIF29_15524 [Crotalaria pallida]|uniref:Uncharacterized protein n=1 Tax=Crotalaria pallida TaxID=3830 RepID=A0AAN9IJ73_CROPI